MLDGFGWFSRANYMRSWLFFDDVEYVLPRAVNPPLDYPDGLYRARQHRIVHTDFPDGCLDLLIEQSSVDARRPEFRGLVKRIPRSDLDYALLVVRCDAELDGRVADELRMSAPFGIAFLVNKLLFHAWITGAVPIMGRHYGREFVRQKMAVAEVGGDRQAAYASFAAGLSFGFVDDAALAAIPFARLENFKHIHRGLLERHQKQLLSVSAAYQGMLEGPSFEEHLESLRRNAARERDQLETEAKMALETMGIDLARNVAGGSSTAFLTGLAVLRGTSLADLVSLGLPAVLAGLGSAAAASMETLAKIRRPKKHAMAYLFEVEKME